MTEAQNQASFPGGAERQVVTQMQELERSTTVCVCAFCLSVLGAELAALAVLPLALLLLMPAVVVWLVLGIRILSALGWRRDCVLAISLYHLLAFSYVLVLTVICTAAYAATGIL